MIFLEELWGCWAFSPKRQLFDRIWEKAKGASESHWCHYILISCEQSFVTSYSNYNYFVYKVHTLFWYSGHVAGWNFGLPTQHLLSDGFSIPAIVWPFPNKQLIGNDSDSIKVCTKRVILPKQYLRSHIAWSSTCFMTVLWLPISGNA